MTIAGLALRRDRLMGIGQAITMPLFFSSSALYPVEVMPGWHGRTGRSSARPSATRRPAGWASSCAWTTSTRRMRR